MKSKILLALSFFTLLMRVSSAPVFIYDYYDGMDHVAETKFDYFACLRCIIDVNNVTVFYPGPMNPGQLTNVLVTETVTITINGKFPPTSDIHSSYYTFKYGNIVLSLQSLSLTTAIVTGSGNWQNGNYLSIYAEFINYPTVGIYSMLISNPFLVYPYPTFTSITTNQVPTTGANISLIGTGWSNSSYDTYLIINNEVTPTCLMDVPTIKMTCYIPPHATTNLLNMTLFVRNTGQVKIPPVIIRLLPTIMWADPMVNTISFRGVVTTGGSLTITGANLGQAVTTPTSSIMVSADVIGSLTCTMTVAKTTLVCTLPSHATTSLLSVTVTVNLLSSSFVFISTNALQYYVAPTMNTPTSLQLRITYSAPITFTGTNMGTSISDVVITNSLGTLPCAITSANVQITCTAPTHAATSWLTVTVTITKYTNAHVFTFSNMMRYVAPSITSVSPSTISVAGGTITLTGQMFGYGVPYFYSGVSTTSVTGTVTSTSDTTMMVNLGARSVATGSSLLPVTLSWPSSSTTSSSSILSFATPTFSTGFIISRFGGTATISGSYFGSTKAYYDGVYVESSGAIVMTGTISTMSNILMTVTFGAFSGSPLPFVHYDLRLSWLSGSGSTLLTSSIIVT
jgi:hypothetical protein